MKASVRDNVNLHGGVATGVVNGAGVDLLDSHLELLDRRRLLLLLFRGSLVSFEEMMNQISRERNGTWE